MESLLLDVPLVCKSWYKASLNPMRWQHLIFPTSYFKLHQILNEMLERIEMKNQEDLSFTAFVKFIVNRSCGNATIIKLPNCCTEEALEYVAKQ